MVLRSVGVLSFGKVLGTMYAAMGLIFGAMFSLISLTGIAVQQPQNGGNNPIPFFIFGGLAVVMFPIIYGIMGFIGGIISAAIYNLIAGFVGGLEFNFDVEPRIG